MHLRFILAATAILTLGGAFGLSNNASAGSGLTASTSSTKVVLGPSGLPVPRFVALKKDEVLARFGPSFDYPVAYEFRREGLPLKVIAEDRDNVWRRVEDRDGRRMWIHRSMLAAPEHVVVHADSAVLRANPDLKAPGRARLTAGVMAKVEACEGDWCRIRAESFRGWLPKSDLWGADI